MLRLSGQVRDLLLTARAEPTELNDLDAAPVSNVTPFEAAVRIA